MCDKVEAVELSDVGAVRQSHVYNLNVMGYIMHLNPPPYKRTVLRAVYIFSTPLPRELFLNLLLPPYSFFPQVIIISTAPDFAFFLLICE